MSTPVRFAPPRISSEVGSFTRRCIGAALSVVAALASTLPATAYAGFSACFAPASGNMQGVVQGTALQLPLVAQASTPLTPLSSTEPYAWSSSTGTVRFSNGQTTANGVATWQLIGMNYFAEVTETAYVEVSTPPGTIQVLLSNPSCLSTLTPFSIFVQPLTGAAASAQFGSENSTVPMNGSALLSLHATHDDPMGGGTLDAVNVPFTFTVTSGPGSFDAADGPGSTKIYTGGGGFAFAELFADSNAVQGQTITVSANAPGYPPVNFNAVVGPEQNFGQLIVVSGDGQQLQPLSASDTVVVRGETLKGPIIGYPVHFEIISGDASFIESGGTTHTDDDGNEDGFYTFTLSAGSTPGPITVRASADGLGETFVNAEIVSYGALEPVGGSGQSGEVGTQLPQPLVVRVPQTAPAANHRANAKNAAAVEFRVIAGQAVFVANNQPILQATVDPATGEASAEVRLGFEIGSITVSASLPGYAPAYFQLSAVAPGTAVTLTPLSAPTLGDPGTESDPMIVELAQSGTLLSGQRIDWQLLSGDATLTEASNFTDNLGRAQNTVLFGASGGSVVVRASHVVLGTNAVVSTDFMLVAGTAVPQIQVLSGNGQTGPVGSVLDHPIEFKLQLLDGTGIAGEVVNFSATGPGTLLNTSATTDADGKASVNLRFGTSAGAVTVTATAPIGPVSTSAIVTSFVPNLSIVSGNNQSGQPGALLPQPLKIKLTGASAPALAKGFGGITVRWSVTCGGGTTATATTLTDVNGESENRWTLGPAPGCNTVRAAVDGVGEVTFNANATVPASSVLEIVSGNGQSLVPLEDSEPLRVRLRTAGGEPLAGVVIRFGADRAEATLTPSEATTASDGTAATVARIGLPAGLVVTARVRDVAAITPVTFTLNAGVVNIPNLTAPQQQVAEAIDTSCPQLASMQNLTAGQQDLLSRCSELVVNAEQDPGEVTSALNEMLADEATGQNAAAMAAASAQFNNIKSRFAALRAGSRGFDLAGLNILGPGGALPLSLLPSAIALNAGEPPEEVGGEFSRWGFFATGTIGRGDRDPESLDPGFRYDAYGITAGVDYRATDSWILGAALGFNRNNTELRQNQGGMDTKGWTLSGYASFFQGSEWYADAVLSFGRNNYDIDRRISYGIDSLSGGRTLIDQLASASPDGGQQSLAVSVGRDFNRNAWTFGPYVRAAYTKLDFDAYTETMSNPTSAGAGLALAVEGRELKSLQGVLGGKLSYAVSTSWGILLPSAQLEWVNEFEDDPEQMVTRFVHDPTNTAILIESERNDSNYFNLGLGLSGVFANGKSAYLYFEHVAGQERMSSSSLAIGVRVEF